MSDTEHNRRIALRMLERIAQGVIDDELVTADVYWWVPGRGDMSRGGLMLRCADSGDELDYVPIAGAVRHGPRPPKLTPLGRELLPPRVEEVEDL